MKRTKLLKSAPCAAPQKTSEDAVIAASQIVGADGEEALEISLFYEGELKARYFADAENHNAWVDGKWCTCKLNNVARMCKGENPITNDYYYMGNETEWATRVDKEIALGFLDAWSMNAYEEEVSIRKRERASERKEEKIRQQMADIPCVPNEVEEWLDREIFPGHILFVKKEEKRTTYSCTACGCRSWKKKGWKQREKTTCPKCGESVTVNSRQKEKTKETAVIILQGYGEKWLERQFRAECKWTEGRKEINMFEELRAIIPKGECWGKVWYGTRFRANECEQRFLDKNPLNNYFVKSYLYPGNLQEVLKYGGLERSGIEILAKGKEKFNVNRFITGFHDKPYLEYIVKAGLSRLAMDIVEKYWGTRSINENAHTLKDALRLDGNRVNRMKKINGGMGALEWLQYEEAEKTKISKESLEYLSSKNVRLRECEGILKELKSVNRMVNYMKKQKVKPGRFMVTWRDYLRMAKNEGYDTTDDIVRFPKDLQARHDYLVEMGNKREEEKKLKEYEKLDKKIKDRLPEAARYFWEDGKYMIIPAGTCGELMKEGRTLHHCVGRDDYYMKKMARGDSWILFLRKKEDLEKAYYTVEIDMKEDRILQYYSEFDRQPEKEEISKVLDKFKKSIKRKKEQIRINAIA